MEKIYTYIYKDKAVPLQAWSSPEFSRMLRFPDFMTRAQDGGKVVSLTHWPHLPPGPQCDQKDLCQSKIPMTPSGIEPATF
jgi:hypothetical protein